MKLRNFVWDWTGLGQWQFPAAAVVCAVVGQWPQELPAARWWVVQVGLYVVLQFAMCLKYDREQPQGR